MDFSNFSSNSTPVLLFVGAGVVAYMYKDQVDSRFFNPASMYFPLAVAVAGYGLGTMFVQRGIPGIATF